MPEECDSERAWLAKFSGFLDEIAGEDIRKEVMKESEELSAHSSRRQVIDTQEWLPRRLHGGNGS